MEYDEIVNPAPAVADLEHISKLAHEMQDLQSALEAVETCAKELKQRLWQLQMRDLPEAVQDLGLQSITLTSGRKLSVKAEYSARISKSRKEEAFIWLRENGFGALIKEQPPVVGVHPMTLKAWIKEMEQQGRVLEIPIDLFHPFTGSKAVFE